MLPIDNDHSTMNPFKGKPLLDSRDDVRSSLLWVERFHNRFSRTWVPQSLPPTQFGAAATHGLKKIPQPQKPVEKVPQPQKPVGDPTQGECTSVMPTLLGPGSHQTTTPSPQLSPPVANPVQGECTSVMPTSLGASRFTPDHHSSKSTAFPAVANHGLGECTSVMPTLLLGASRFTPDHHSSKSTAFPACGKSHARRMYFGHARLARSRLTPDHHSKSTAFPACGKSHARRMYFGHARLAPRCVPVHTRPPLLQVHSFPRLWQITC
jgi:hypothetical protein